MTHRGSDPLLRRIERRALAVCLAATCASLILRPRMPGLAAGVIGGGVLSAVSYWAIRSGVDGLLGSLGAEGPRHDPGPGEPRAEAGTLSSRHRAIAGFVAKFMGRYALLALLAYVMIARLRLHPVGMLMGVSSIVVAVSLEAVASPSARRGGRHQDPPGTSRAFPGN